MNKMKKLNKRVVYPTKTTINLANLDKNTAYYQKLAALSVLGAILILAFSKFAVVDRFLLESRVEREASEMQRSYDSLVNANSRYQSVKAEYNKYFKDSTYDGGFADVLDVIRLVDFNLAPKGHIEAYVFKDNKLALNLSGVNLENASDVVNTLYSNNIVGKVTLNSVDNVLTKDAISSISLIIDFGEKEGGTK